MSREKRRYFLLAFSKSPKRAITRNSSQRKNHTDWNLINDVCESERETDRQIQMCHKALFNFKEPRKQECFSWAVSQRVLNQYNVNSSSNSGSRSESKAQVWRQANSAGLSSEGLGTQGSNVNWKASADTTFWMGYITYTRTRNCLSSCKYTK